MDLMAYWKMDIYRQDMPKPIGYHFNSNKPRLHDALSIGSRLWLVSSERRSDRLEFVLLASLVVARKTTNPPGYGHGRYRVIADPHRSRYFDPDGPDLTDDVLRRLELVGGKAISPEMPRKDIPMALLSMRGLTGSDEDRLESWAAGLPVLRPTFVPPPG